ncbi:hypothetical protein [Horticoccus sp. 23ND18S-11]|uniref:hypothetical protein n=1 Tax=Horticoccus sp. 23ND18S-11 TaxID=3391832 RepID=UPI0039C8CED7
MNFETSSFLIGLIAGIVLVLVVLRLVVTLSALPMFERFMDRALEEAIRRETDEDAKK